MKTTNLRTVPLAEIIDLPAHPVADFFPMLSETDKDRERGKAESQTISLSELADSIMKSGLQEPIVLFDGQLLDGRNRRAACQLAAKVHKIPLTSFGILVEDFEGTEEEAEEYILNLNVDRRDLTPGQRASAAAKYWDYEAEKAKERLKLGAQMTNASLGRDVESPMSNLTGATGTTRDVLARRFRVSNSYIDKIHKEQEQAERLREQAQDLQDQAELEKLRQEEAKIALEEAKELADAEAIAKAAREANEATLKQAELLDQANEASQKANEKQSNLDKIGRGESVNSVYGEKKKEPTDDDPIGKLKTQVNQNVSNLKKIITELATLTAKGDEIYDFLGTRFQNLCDHLQDEFEIEQAFDCYIPDEEIE